MRVPPWDARAKSLECEVLNGILMRQHFNTVRSRTRVTDNDSRRESGFPPLDEMIGRRLQRHYQELENEPMSDRLQRLMQMLDGTQPHSAKDRPI
jgi:hypothetical protein